MTEIRSHVSGTNSICCHNLLTQSSQKIFPHYSRNVLPSETLYYHFHVDFFFKKKKLKKLTVGSVFLYFASRFLLWSEPPKVPQRLS